MGRLMTVELRRIASARSTWGVVLATIAITTISALQTNLASEHGKALWERQGYLFATMVTQLFLLILGAKAVTDDFRYGTIIPSVLVTPDRSRIVAAKLGALAIIGSVAATLVAACAVVASWSQLGNGLQVNEVRSLAGFVLAGAMYVPLGGAVGYLVRHQVGAIMGVVAWSMFINQMLGQIADRWSMYLPGDAGGALALASTTRTMLVGGLILMLYTVGGGIGSAIAMSKRDVI